MRRSKGFLRGALCGALVMLGIIVLGGLFCIKVLGLKSAVGKGTETKLDLINYMIDQYYLYSDTIDTTVMQDQLLKGYVNGLGDPYSVYYNQEETKELMESVTGEFNGIGVVLSQDAHSKIITFVTVYDNSPAKEAGFQDGDVLNKVNGEDITGQDLNEVVMKLKGEKGTKVIVSVLRGEQLEEVTAPITRREIQVPTIAYEMKENQVGYIRISQFEEVTVSQFQSALQTLQDEDIKALVLDVRANPGGSLSTVCEVLDRILPEGTIVYTEDKYGKRKTYTSDAERQLALPIAVLIDGNSASASEIFAGAIRDYQLGILVGTKTYGKGIVQQLFPLTDSSCLKLTISEYFTPNGNNIHGVGIIPDVEVQYEYDKDNPTADNQLEKALEILNEKIDK